MAWLLIVTSLAMVWVASLSKILLASSSKSKASFLDGGSTSGKKNVLLVIAHPDDETMFFSPTINYLTARRHNVHILCLSTGNADGMGNIRKEELYLASAILKVPLQQVKVVNHPNVQDGFGKVWNSNLLAGIIDDEICSSAIDLVITFDHFGVSGHCNHCDVHRGVRKLLETTKHKVDAWELVSTNIFRKYSGPVDIWFSMLHASRSLNGQMHCLLNERPKRSYAAMAQHGSQWVWFRKLFVSFSSYTYVNTLKMIK
ncbi:hypothetical protein M9H77_31484 [Catharanthus roseus]|uniref:Uncharacterized protein n=1 Tax=Catharanthus roseus TaxID=4058 RepID=A0ACC0A086_CATRO|nr:hypothetical protein M9H77_31484 [Catharanthus roseus]